MEISKSTPYVRYRENISSTLHKGTIHIESEYLDRERKTTIESIEGQTWQNMVNGENKEEDILPRLGLKIEGNEDVFDTVEQHMPIDTIIGDVEPVANEDGTYTYEISTMEGSYAKTLEGENNFSLTSDGLVGDMYIKYNAQGEEVNGNIVMNNGQSSYTIENSNNGEINNVTLKGQTLVNLVNNVTSGEVGRYNGSQCRINVVRDLQDETLTIIFNVTSLEIPDGADGVMRIGGGWSGLIRHNPTLGVNKILYNFTQSTNNWLGVFSNLEAYDLGQRITISDVMILEGDYTNVDIPYFEGMQSVVMPVLMTSNEDDTKSNILSTPSDLELRRVGDVPDELDLETGVLTQRIGEVVLDGSENWLDRNTDTETHKTYYLRDLSIKDNTPFICDKLPNSSTTGTNCIFSNGWDGHYFFIRLDKTIVNNVSELKAYLQSNPITVQYLLAQESVKTVDLTIKNQDDKIIQSLHTHPSTTHINLSSNGLIPNAELSYTMYGNIGETTGEQITDGTDSKLIEGKIYGDTLCNVLPSPSLKNSMDYNTSMQKLNNGYDNINVVDGKFKKATLYGQTLVNLINLEKFISDSNMLYTYELPVKNNTTYTVIATLKGSDKIDSTRESVLRIKSNDNNGSDLIGTQQIEPNNTSAVINIFSTIEVTTQNNLYIRLYNTLPKNLKIMILEGDYTNQDIPYFEGMQSVVMPSLTTCGKNLFNKEAFYNDWKSKEESYVYKEIVDNEEVLKVNNFFHLYEDNKGFRINVEKGVPLTVTMECKKAGTETTNAVFTIRYGDDKYAAFPICHSDEWETNTTTFTPTRDYITICSGYNNAGYFYVKNMQIEEGSTVTSYEPHKSNTLTTLEDVSLRAVGDVRDELDLMTGEATQRIGEIVLDGSQDGEYNHTYDESLGILTIRLPKITNIKNDGVNLYGLLSDKYVSVTNKSPNNIMAYNGRIMITKPISELESFSTSDKIKSFLSQNPITLQYPLQTPITETINPTITNQGNQSQTTLHSIANGYISTSSQGLLPKVDYEVPTSNSYYLVDMVEPNTQYTTKSSSDCNAIIDGTSYPLSANGTFTTPSTITDNLMVLDAQVDDLMFIEGDLTGRGLDYFIGLNSVENPIVEIVNKNIVDVFNEPYNPDKNLYDSGNGTTAFTYVKEEDAYKTQNHRGLTFKAKIGQNYAITMIGKRINSLVHAYIYGFSDGTRGGTLFNSTTDYTTYTTVLTATTENPHIVLYGNCYFKSIQIEIANEASEYIEHQHIHLTTQQPISLYRIGDVKDELDLVNECVVRRIGEIVLDGNTKFSRYSTTDTHAAFYMSLNYNGYNNKTIATATFLSDSLRCYNYDDGDIVYFEIKHSILGTTKNDDMQSVVVPIMQKWLTKNPVTVLYQLETPTTESVRIVPQNPKQSTVSLTLQSPLQKVGNVADQLRWNPYKGHYVRYNYIQDGVANSTYTFEDLKDMNERKFVNLYNQRTYIDTDHTVQVISHGISRYCLAEQGKQYQVRWDWVQQPSVDTIKVDLCGNVKEIPSSDNSVIIDIEKFTHQFIQIQGLGLTGKITNLMVIETVNGEIPDVDFFSGIQCVGNTVNIDGNTKVQINMEQTNGNLLDGSVDNLEGKSWRTVVDVKPNQNYSFNCKALNNETYSSSFQIYIEQYNDNTIISSLSINSNSLPYNFTTNNKTNNIKFYTSHVTDKGNLTIHRPIELCYADMAKDGIRPRYYDKESIILPMKLCRVGNIYDNLYYDDLKGYYRIQQSIGHKYFTGETTEVWTMETTDGYRTIKFTCTSANIDQIAYGGTICNQWKHLSTINDDIEGFIVYNGNFVLRIDKDRLTDKTVDGFKTLLASSPIHLFYQLKTPQMINLTEYPNRIELNTYRDEIFTFFKGMNPTKFTLSVPMDKTYRYEIAEEGQGLANRVAVNNETISAENMVAVKEVRGQGIANIIEDVDNVVITPRPNHGAVATSHTLNNTKPATIGVHGFEASGETAVANYNVTDKAYQLKVMSSNGDNSLSDYYVLNVPYKLETYADGTKDMVYYDEVYKQWHFKGSSVKEYTVASNGTLDEIIEIFKGLAPRSGMIAEFKLMFTSGATSSRIYYSLDGVTYAYTQLRYMSDGNYLYVGIFNTGGTKIDIAYKTDPNAEYTNFAPLSTQIPECFMINQITSCTFCELTLDKQYIYSEMNSPIELDAYDGTTKVFMDGNATDTNIIIRNDATTKIVNTYTDTEYTVYWKYVDGLGNLRITLGGTTVEVDGKQEYATIKTQLNAPQELLYVGGYNLSIKDLMVVKGAKINDLPYFEGSRQVGTLVLDEEGNKSYKITLVQGGSVLEQRDEDTIAFKDDNKHNVVVHKIVGVCPTKVD